MAKYNTIGNLNAVVCSMQRYYNDVEQMLMYKTGLTPLTPAMQDYLKHSSAADTFWHRSFMVIGRPGTGKTGGTKAIVKRVQEKLKAAGRKERVGFVCISLSQTIVGEFNSLPVAVDGHIENFISPKLPSKERGCEEYGILLLDEITSANVQQVQPALALTDPRGGFDGYHFPEGWIVCAAGNGVDCSNFLRLDDMTLRRFFPYEIDFRLEDWKEYAHAQAIHPSILSFLSANDYSGSSENYLSPEMRDESEVENDCAQATASPANWEKLSSVMQEYECQWGKPFTGQVTYRKGTEDIYTDQYQTISYFLGHDIGLKFSAYLEMVNTLKTVDSKDMAEEDLARFNGVVGEVGKKIVTGEVFTEYEAYAKKHNFPIDRATGAYAPHCYGLDMDTYSYFMQDALSKIGNELQDVVNDYGTPLHEIQDINTMQNSKLCQYLANFIRWFSGYPTLSVVLSTWAEIRRQVKVKGSDGLMYGVDAIIASAEFASIMCPELDAFLQEYSDYLGEDEFNLDAF